MRHLLNVKNCIYVMAALMISIFCFGASSVTSHAASSTDYDYTLVTCHGEKESSAVTITYYIKILDEYRNKNFFIYRRYSTGAQASGYNYILCGFNSNTYTGNWGPVCSYYYTTSKGSSGSDNSSSFGWVDYEQNPSTYKYFVEPTGTLVDSMASEIPVFDDLELAWQYWTTGDRSGAVNNPDYDDPDLFDENFYFEGFKGDNFVNASWTGVSERSNLLDVDVENYVRVSIGYAEKGSTDITVKDPIDEDFEYEPMKLSIDVSEYKNTYDDMYVRAVYFTPCYRISGAFFYGSASVVLLKENGNLDKIDSHTSPITSNVSLNGVYDENIPTPKLVTTDVAYECYFSNASDEYYIEMQGRTYTVDDIELYKENLTWKYKYSTIHKTSLSVWVSPESRVLSRGGHNTGKYAASSFNELLLYYPIDDRNYYGGSNAVSNYLFGYDDALTMLKETLLPNLTSAFNGIEIYVRFFTVEEDGTYKYGKWCHWYDNLASASGSTGSTWDDKTGVYGENQSVTGLTDNEKDNIESSSNSKSGDTDIASSIVDNASSLDTTQLFSSISSLFSDLGQIPTLISTLMSFLPSWLISLIAVSIGLLVVIGVAKAVL